MQAPSSASFFIRHEFLIRRLHSLSGLVPVGAYMVIHLLTNATVLDGPATYQDQVDRIHSLGIALPFVEWTFIFLPIIFHAAVGVWIINSGQQNSVSYPYPNNIRYTLQRVTAWIALFFIFLHVFQMHGWFHTAWWTTNVAEPLGGARFDPQRATSSAALALAPVAVLVFYSIGILACVYHLANGIWTAGITWGLWTTPAAQRRADWVCAAFGVLLAVVGIGALAGFGMAARPDNLAEAEAIEEVRIADREAQAAEVERRAEELRHEKHQPAAADAAQGRVQRTGFEN